MRGLICILILFAAAARADSRRPLLVTVDDLPMSAGALHGEIAERQRITHALLAVLARHQVPAVGLVTWSHVHGPSDLRLLDAWLARHELGNHSHRHLQYNRTPIAEYVADVESARTDLVAYLSSKGKALRFFRYPFLCEGNTPAKLDSMRAYLARTRQRNLPVTIDTQDWAFEEAWVAARRRKDRAAQDSIGIAYQNSLRAAVQHYESAGDGLLGRPTPQILLLHANEIGAAQWDALFTWLASTGHRFATANEVLADSAFGIPTNYVGDAGCSLWLRILDSRRRQVADAAVRALLEEQAEDWNRGDLEAFCSVYADSALFVSTSGSTHGREAVLTRYRKRYPDRAAMGTLSFEVIAIDFDTGVEVTMLGDAVPSAIHGATLTARWKLAFPGKDTATGITVLHLRWLGGAWEIVHDASM
jgi:uncharacterized protein (TIGR02246 family)